MQEQALAAVREHLLQLGLTADLQQVMAAGSLALGTPLLLGDALLDVLAWTGDTALADGTWEDFIAAGYAPAFESGSGFPLTPHPLPHGFYACQFPNGRMGWDDLIIDLAHQGEDLGHLVVSGQGGTACPDMDGVLGALCLGISAQLRQLGQGEGRLAVEGLLLRLLRGEEIDPGILRFRARLAGLESEGDFSLLLVDTKGHHPQKKSMSAVRNELETATGSVGVMEGEVLTLLAQNGFDEAQCRLAGEILTAAKFRGVYTAPFTQLSQLPPRHRLARQQLALRCHLKDDTPLIPGSQLEIFYLAQLASKDGATELHPILQTLEAADQGGRSAYLDTLFAYLQHAQKPAATCDYLHIHRNTLDYRLRRIEALAPLNWGDGALLFRLYFGLCLRQYERGK